MLVTVKTCTHGWVISQVAPGAQEVWAARLCSLHQLPACDAQGISTEQEGKTLLTREPFFESPSLLSQLAGAFYSVKRQFPIHHHHPRDTLRGCGSHKRPQGREQTSQPEAKSYLSLSSGPGGVLYSFLEIKLHFLLQLTHQVSI